MWYFFFSSRRRHTRSLCDWSSDVCSSDLWVTDLADIPSKYGVSNVYADVGQLFAQTTIADPRVSAAMMGMLIRGLGADQIGRASCRERVVSAVVAARAGRNVERNHGRHEK